jgi:hypothetical protein
MTEQLIVELCRIIWNFDEFRRKEELPPNLRETAEWAVSVGKALTDGKTLPSGMPVEPWAPRADQPSYFKGGPVKLVREAVLEGNLV